VDGQQDAAQNVLGVHERHKTIRTIVICTTIVFVVMIAAWTIVRVYTHDFWLELLVILFGPAGIVSVWLTFCVRRLTTRVRQAITDLPPAGGGPHGHH